jgi:indolepyruvate ferredoxin oxidoreductase beta subunit
MARRAHVDYLVALEELEALRYAHFVKPGGTILVNRLRIEPARIGDERSYPPNAIEFLSARNFRAIGIEANAKASELGNYRTANVILLGALAVHLDIPGEVWRQTLADRIPAKLLDLNLRAFTAGQALVA